MDCLPCPRARRTPPSKLRIELQQVSKTARRLLKHLGVDKTAVAYDGPGNVELLETLAWAEDYDESAVITATRRIGPLVEVLEAVEASELPRVDRLTSARHRDGGFSYVAAMSLRMTSCVFQGVRTSVMFALPTEADMLSARIDVC